jgi:hypothetical protein
MNKYNRVICKAHPKLYDLYLCLYVRNQTQEDCAEDMGYSPEYIRKLNRQLINFFLKELNAVKED